MPFEQQPDNARPDANKQPDFTQLVPPGTLLPKDGPAGDVSGLPSLTIHDRDATRAEASDKTVTVKASDSAQNIEVTGNVTAKAPTYAIEAATETGTAKNPITVNPDGNGGILKTNGIAFAGGDGVVSKETIGTDGIYQFTVGSLKTMFVGMDSQINSNNISNPPILLKNMNYAFGLENGQLHIFENGTIVKDSPVINYAVGDVLAVQRIGGVIQYVRNGEIIYTSTQKTSANLQAIAAMLDNGSQILNSRIYSGTAFVQQGVHGVGWKQLLQGGYESDDSNGGIRVVGSSSENDVTSSDFIPKNCPGFVEVTTNETNSHSFIGLAAAESVRYEPSPTPNFKYAIELANGIATIYEQNSQGQFVPVHIIGSYATGDDFVINVDANQNVTYSLKGNIVYTSTEKATNTNLRVGVRLLTTNATLANVRIFSPYDYVEDRSIE